MNIRLLPLVPLGNCLAIFTATVWPTYYLFSKTFFVSLCLSLFMILYVKLIFVSNVRYFQHSTFGIYKLILLVTFIFIIKSIFEVKIRLDFLKLNMRVVRFRTAMMSLIACSFRFVFFKSASLRWFNLDQHKSITFLKD